MDGPKIIVPAGRGLVLSLRLEPGTWGGFRLGLWRAPSARDRKVGIRTNGQVAFVVADRASRPRLCKGDEYSAPCIWLENSSFVIPEASRARLAAWLKALPSTDAPAAQRAAGIVMPGAVH